jgi:hypothetical protein
MQGKEPRELVPVDWDETIVAELLSFVYNNKKNILNDERMSDWLLECVASLTRGRRKK